MKITDEFENKVADFAKANDLFGPAARILLAVSGGADSTALMYAIWTLKKKNVLRAELLCAHINHQLRAAEADKDEDFVIKEAAKLKLPVITKRVDVRGFALRNKLSIETAARKLRMENLLDIAKTNNCDAIYTAHQKDDNAETVLQRLIRGTGFRGLGGIWPKRNFAGINFIRPLLCAKRDEIIEYLKKQNIKWRDDHTNIDCSYRRNFIRHRLLPTIQKQCSSSISELLFDLSRSAQHFHGLICSETDKLWDELATLSDEKVSLNLKSFSIQPQPVKIELARRSLTKIGSGEGNLTHRHFENILRLAESNVSGRKTKLPDGFMALREYENLIFSRPQKSEAKNLSSAVCPPSSVILNIPGKTEFGHYQVEAIILDSGYSAGRRPVEILDTRRKNSKFENRKSKIHFVERFDLDKIKLPLVIRARRTGDRFWPLGLAGEKKAGKFLTAAKVPPQIRKKVLVVADSEKIIWLWPVRMSEQAKITSKSGKILQIQITDTNP